MTSIAAGVETAVRTTDKHDDNTHSSAVAALRNKLLPTAYQTVHNVPNSVHVFGGSDVAEDELIADLQNSVEMSELRPRAGKVRNKKESVEPVFVVRDIESGDTLQSFSLQFGCPVAELKRHNNLINDQDFFALRRIKIPIKQHGLLTEEQEEMRRRPNAISETKPDESHLANGGFVSEDEESDYGEEDNLLVRQISIRDSMRDKTTARQFLQKMDQDLEKICQATQTQKSSLEEVTSILTETRIHPLLLPYFQKKKKRTTCDGATCGMTWKSVVLIIIVVITVPVLILCLHLYQNSK